MNSGLRQIRASCTKRYDWTSEQLMMFGWEVVGVSEGVCVGVLSLSL